MHRKPPIRVLLVLLMLAGSQVMNGYYTTRDGRVVDRTTGMMIGFDIQVNDNDSDRRECKIAWKAKHDISCKSPDYLGVIQLVEQ